MSSNTKETAGTDVRIGGGVADLREPLLPLYLQSSSGLDLLGQGKSNLLVEAKSPSPQNRPFTFGSPGSSCGSESSSDLEETVSSSGDRECSGVMTQRNNVLVAEDQFSDGSEVSERRASRVHENSSVPNLRRKVEAWSAEHLSECEEIQPEDGVSQMDMMQLKLEAMTWAAMAKDFTITSLEKRLRKALQIAKAEQLKNQELQGSIDEGHLREKAMAQQLENAKKTIEKLEEAEERLCQQLGEVEVDASEHEQQHRMQLAKLVDRVKAQDDYIARSLTKMEYGWEGRNVEQLEQEISKSQEMERKLSEKLDMANREIENLRRELSDASIDLRVSEVMRNTQSRRLKGLEKERRYLMRKGALRSVKLAHSSLQKRESPAMPGGQGWNVFSVLEFAE